MESLCVPKIRFWNIGGEGHRFQTFEIHSRVIGWDSKWVFFEHRFVRKDRVLGVVAGRVVLKAQSGPVESVAVGHAEFLKDFGPRVTELLDRLQKAAGVSERPMTLGDLDILAAASWELLTTTLANMPESQRRIWAILTHISVASVALRPPLSPSAA